MGAVDTEVHGKAARRQLAYAVLLCLVGAGLAVFAATRIWAVEVTARPAPLPSVRVTRTGGELLPWLPALAVVGLAGAGAVLATRGMGRRLVGVLLLLVGLAVAVGGGYGVAGLAHEDTTVGWPALCVLGGVLALAGGAVTVLRGGSWPVMGARYERRSTRENSPVQDGSAAGSMAANDGKGPVVARRTVAAWDALDRGEDPTVS
ncbi:Trp biosynthesis-associated membrane protein [Micromonospora polyrhachis]|nr:Trp biosynthesis-associated membrane protein [Micromonospora polyrhachis]